MSTELHDHAVIVADHYIARCQAEALAKAAEQLTRALESQPREVCPDVMDAIRAILAQSHLTVDQKAALTTGLATRLGALLEPAAARPALFAVGEDA